MADERVLKRLGVFPRHPARRRSLCAMLPPECTDEALRALAFVAGDGETLAGWLLSGEWRPRWETERARRAEAEAATRTPERLALIAATRVLADHRPVAEVAEELGLNFAEVANAVTTEARRRGMSDEDLEIALGLTAGRQRSLPELMAERAPAVVEAPPVVVPRPPITPDDVKALYLRAGRRAPKRIVDALTGGLS